MRIRSRTGLVPLLALALAGCSAAGATNASGQHAGSASAPPSASGPSSATDAGVASTSAGDQCRYLSVDEVRQALAYQDQMSASQDSSTGDPRCQYVAPGNGFVDVIVVVKSGRKYYDDEKSLNTAADCTSAGVGTESMYCPKSQQGFVVFVADGSSVSVSVTNIQSIAGPKGTDSTRAALALAKLAAGRI